MWRRIAAPRAGLPGAPLARHAVDRFAAVVSAALADHLLGPGHVAPAAVVQSRLVNRFNAVTQRNALAQIAETGIDCVVLKGVAFAHTLYPVPELRTIGDLDILVQQHDRDRLIASLRTLGYAFRLLPRPPWGFISTASYMPFVSADGACNVDIHVQPDCYPAYRSLTTAHVFAAARSVEAAGLTFRVPSDTHAFLLCATNAAKDKFGVFAARKIVDALLLLHRGGPDLDAVRGFAEAGGYSLPVRVFLALLAALGGALPGATVALPRRSRGEFARLLHETQCMYPEKPGLLATLRRELILCTEPAVGVHNGLRRLIGLVRPGTGVPDEATTAS